MSGITMFVRERVCKDQYNDLYNITNITMIPREGEVLMFNDENFLITSVQWAHLNKRVFIFCKK
jgi:hypothetical protein